MELTTREAQALLACEGGVQVWSADVLEALNALAARMPADDAPLFASEQGGYRRATAAGLQAARAALRRGRVERFEGVEV